MRQEGLLVVALGLSLALLLALGWVAVGEARETVRMQGEIARTQRVVEQAEKVVPLLSRAENAVFAFQAGGDESLLDPYRDARAGLQDELAALSALVANEPDQRQALGEVETAVNERVRILDGRIDQRRKLGRPDAAATDGARAEERRVRATVERHLRSVEDGARRRLLERSSRAEASARANLRTSALFSVGAAVLYFVLFGLLVHRMHGLRRATEATKTLHQDLVSRQADLERVRGELDAFSYSVSHDLRAPLRAVDGYSRILLDDHGETLDAEGRRVIGVLRSEVKRMGQLLDGLLALSRLDRQEVTMADVDLGEVVERALAGVRSAEGARAVDVAVGPLPTVRGDATLLHQVFYNLLANAFKFTRSREQAVIRVRAEREGGDHVVSITDNGVGFPPQRAARLFGVFHRLHDDPRYEGVGVGLVIVDRIVRRHGGRVSAEAVEGGGATFRVVLPAPPS
jgi:signal transduction histidine kinase